ncbi:probable zinc metalloprotease EGY2, chloroplastic [Zingiber officinale]|uniref:probable zinc metalloprotease EGY2, chloroplastic n=1 Tax=Zingiber officinale TaxID=94328 RepID=UPI001C4B8F2F|nr:probable zinc metalloprotease EGY2, chloroplastic [Zingiber officinale]
MSFTADLSCASQCFNCSALRSWDYLCTPAFSSTNALPFRSFYSKPPTLLRLKSRRYWIACQGMTETEPDNDEEKDKDVASSNKLLDQEVKVENNEEEFVTQNSDTVKDDELEFAIGSPLPGMKQQFDETMKISKAIIDILKDQVFGFDTFFVTSQETYEGGVLFKGNLRGKPAKSYEKITNRMQGKFGDQYKLFLLINPEDDKPVAVVVPKQTLQPETTAVPEWFAAGAFGLVTIFTLLLRNVPFLQSNLLSTFDNLELLKNGLPGAFITALIIGVHEFGHILIARDTGIKLGVPFFVPSWQIGSFGAITRILSIVPSREDLLKLSAAGPLAGFAAGALLLILGFILPPIDGIGIVVDPAVFHESFLAGGIAKLLLGDVLKEGSPLSINPLVLWAWTGLIINAINSIPTGELDGGRISFAIWGRKTSTRISGVTIALLGISSLFNDVAFYWTVLVFFLQRGPIAPLADEITEPETKYIGLGVAVLLLGLLVYLPYPFPFYNEGVNFDF